VKHSLFGQATEHNFPEDSEDRLTQVVAACFNHSAEFRRQFLRFLGINYPDCWAETQVQEGESRPDIWIRSGRRQVPVALIESKTSTRAHLDQLAMHEGVSAKHRFVIIEHPDGIYRPKWTVKYWAEFADLLAKSCNNCAISQQASEYFKERGIMSSLITRSDLKNAGAFLDQVRFKKQPACSGDTLLALSKIQNVLELVADFAREDQQFLKAFKLDRRFSTSVKISSWYEVDARERAFNKLRQLEKKLKGLDLKASERKQIKDLVRAQIHHRQNGVTLEKKIKVRRRSNGIDGLGIMLSQPIGGGKATLSVTIWKKMRFVTLLERFPESIPSAGLGAKQFAKESVKAWIKSLRKSHDF
jgi:hypothetical protein